jgi:exodeoxyribonuclease V gamma subunit
VLISQLRDTLNQGWQLPNNTPALLSAMTVEHPLQPFSPQYVAKNRDSTLYTYAQEWFDESDLIPTSGLGKVIADEQDYTLTLSSLARFLKAPVKSFCNHTLKFGFDTDSITSEDNEPFAFNPLERYGLRNELLKIMQSQKPDETGTFFDLQREALARKGKLPLGGFAQAAYSDLADPVNQVWQYYQTLLELWPTEIDSRAVDLHFSFANNITVQLSGDLGNLRQSCDGQQCSIFHLIAQTLINGKQINYHNLLLFWVQHLAGCAIGLNLQTRIIGSDTVLEISPITQTEATVQLQLLIEAWHQGMQAPLPVASKTAFAWLGASPEKAMETAQAKYEGDDWNDGEVDQDAYLGRFFPSFASLMPEAAQAGFVEWSNTLYLSTFTQIKQQEVPT